MRSYAFGTDFDTLDPAVLAGFAPYLRTGAGDGDLVAVGTRDGGPVDAPCWPLAALAEPGGYDRFGEYWARSGAQALHLVAVTADRQRGAELIGAASTALAAVRPDLVDGYRCLVTGAGRWAYVHDLLDGRDQLKPVAFPDDDATAIVEALAVRAAVRRSRELQRHRPPGIEPGQPDRFRVEQIRAERETVGHHERTAADVRLYHWCASADELSACEALTLGIAAADNAEFRSWLVGQLLAGADSAASLWFTVAAHHCGTERAIAGALAALAAWIGGDDVALAAAEAALEADEDCPLAWTVWGLLETGIGAEGIDAIGLRAALPPQAGAPVAPHQRA